MSKKYKRSHIKRQSDLDGLFESWEERNENGDLVYYKDSNGFEERISYDERGNVIRRETSDSIVIERSYDDKNNEIFFRTNDSEDSVIGTITRENKYDDDGKLIYYKDSKGFEKSYKYDDEGRVIHTSDSNGLNEYMMYDKNGNRISYVTSTGHFENQFYDDNGNTLYYIDNNGYFHADYDENGNILSKCISRKNKFFEERFDTAFEWYDYDENGKLDKITYSGGAEEVYQYKSGHLNSVETIDSDKKTKSIKRYDEFGNMIFLKYGDDYIIEAEYEY